jgi:hypothetical protein
VSSELLLRSQSKELGLKILSDTNRRIGNRNANITGLNIFAEYITVEYINSLVFVLAEYTVIK